MYLKNQTNIARLLFDAPKVVNISQKDDIEVQPNVFSSIYVNLKAPLASPLHRKKLINIILQTIPKKVDHICGIESGGSYYASAIADLIDKKVILYRKQSKQYNSLHNFVGMLPNQNEVVLIIDDVISSGNTLSKAVHELKKRKCIIKVIVIFSYGWDKEIARRMKVEIKALTNAKKLIKEGKKNKRFSNYNCKMIEEYIKREKQRLYKNFEKI